VIPLAPEIDDEHDQPAEDAMKPEQPDQATLRAETRRLLERKIDELPAAFRVVFVLRAVEEMSVEETALALDIPEATVRSRFFRARGLLRESLARQIDGAMNEAFAFAGGRCDRIVAGVLTRLRSGVPPDT
jgi:RNA polymerase sigma-70 factor (ECF subfamily)